MGLKPAHKGYRYQDILCAYVIVESLITGAEVTVDRKLVHDDRIDDITVVEPTSQRRRVQVKHSADSTREVAESDFTNKKSSLRIDKLLLTWRREAPPRADDMRLFATWLPPSDILRTYLLPAPTAPALVEGHGRRFRLDCDAVWPLGGAPVWSWLTSSDALLPTEKTFTRDEFSDFCDRFLMELDAPRMSQTLTSPGELEGSLLRFLATRIGIGQYPNADRRVEDVAALVIALANLARTDELTLTPGFVERELSLRTDFGHVAQTFPVEREFFQVRDAVETDLVERALGAERFLLVGSPGMGKSWLLTDLADRLQEMEDVLVARHYCHVAPTDPDAEARVTVNTLLGNLVYELTIAAPWLHGAVEARYAASSENLETMLRAASEAGMRVVLVIDGLDHIARVKAASTDLSLIETAIVEAVSDLDLPECVSVVLGTQPGRHLDTLSRSGSGFERVTLGGWADAEVEGLLRVRGLHEVLAEFGFEGGLAPVVQAADGNPLLATLLSKEVASGARDGRIQDLKVWAMNLPDLDGDAEQYYMHLYASVPEANVVADLLGVLDFGVTTQEVGEILGPSFARHADTWLCHLSPLLVNVSSQGGIRVFHESFRRFVLGRLDPSTVGHVVGPVNDWLRRRGFWVDSRAFRFLLPGLMQEGKNKEVLSHFTPDFVTRTLECGYPREAARSNINVAVRAAAAAEDWNGMVRCVELARALYTAHEEHLHDPSDYWTTFVQLVGAEVARERLLFDGKPVLSRAVGLSVCDKIAVAGLRPPWEEYLDAPRASEDYPHDEPRGEWSWEWAEALAAVRGRLALDDVATVLQKVQQAITQSPPPPNVLRELGILVGESADPNVAREFFIAVRRDWPWEESTPLTALLSGLQCATSQRAPLIAANFRRLALNYAGSISDIRAVLQDHGQHPRIPVDAHSVHLSVQRQWCSSGGGARTVSIDALPAMVMRTFVPRLLADTSPTSEHVSLWVDWLRVLSWLGSGPSPQADDVFAAREGWYFRWLQFVVMVAQAAAFFPSMRRDYKVMAAFQKLASDAHPFNGKPRAVDLHGIREQLYSTIRWALALVEDEETRTVCMAHLVDACRGTRAWFDQGEWGPLRAFGIVEIIAPFAEAGNVAAKEIVRELVAELWGIGTYYGDESELGALHARLLHKTGDIGQAEEMWLETCRRLSAYGFRKDYTADEVTETFGALVVGDKRNFAEAASAAQKLSSDVPRHCERVSHMPGAWFREYLDAAPAQAVAVLASTLLESDGGGWIQAQAVESCLRVLVDRADPIALWSLAETQKDPGNRADASDVEVRLKILEQACATNTQFADESLRRFIVQVENYWSSLPSDFNRLTERFAAEHGLSMPAALRIDVQSPERNGKRTNPPRVPKRFRLREPVFPDTRTAGSVQRALRQHANAWRFADERSVDDLVLALGYHVAELASGGQLEESKRLLRFFARYNDYARSTMTHPVAWIAEGLERMGLLYPAGVAYALAFPHSRGGGGWVDFGGESHAPLWESAVRLIGDEANTIIAEEVAFKIQATRGERGIAAGLIAGLAGLGRYDDAHGVWVAAYEVIRYRVPSSGGMLHFVDCAGELPTWNLEEGLIALILARLGDPRLATRQSALTSLVRLLDARPADCVDPMTWFLERSKSLIASMLVLEAIRMSVSTDEVVRNIRDTMRSLSASTSWGLAKLASDLLIATGFVHLVRGETD